MWGADSLEHLLLFEPYHASQRDALQALLDAAAQSNPQLQSAARRRIGYGRACWFYLSLDRNYSGAVSWFWADVVSLSRDWFLWRERGRLLPHNSRLQNLTPDRGVAATSSLNEVRL